VCFRTVGSKQKKERDLKYRANYRLAIGFSVLGLLFLTAIWIGKSPLIIFGWFVGMLLLTAFFKTRTYAVEGERLKASYIFGLFPREFDLRQVKGVKVTEWNPPVKVSGFYQLITLSSRYGRLKTIKVDLGEGKKLKIDGQTLHSEDYVKLINKLKKR
jgi:hypothetical protein